jgi:hypothetical protein
MVYKSTASIPLQRGTTDDEMEFDEASTSPTSTRLPDALEMKLI